MKIKHLALVIAVLILTALGVHGSETLSLKVANLSEDVTDLTKAVGQLRLEVEELNRENEDLRRTLNQVSAENVQLKAQLNKEFSQFAQLKATLDGYKETIVTQVSTQFEQLSKETQKAVDDLAKHVSKKKEAQAKEDAFKFSEDYPKEGVAYTVKSGDTLSVIAQKHNSSTKDIQNANKLADPKALKAGQIIFIPQKTKKD